jgi:hypothetical protein
MAITIEYISPARAKYLLRILENRSKKLECDLERMIAIGSGSLTSQEKSRIIALHAGLCDGMSENLAILRAETPQTFDSSFLSLPA